MRPACREKAPHFWTDWVLTVMPSSLPEHPFDQKGESQLASHSPLACSQGFQETVPRMIQAEKGQFLFP